MIVNQGGSKKVAKSAIHLFIKLPIPLLFLGV